MSATSEVSAYGSNPMNQVQEAIAGILGLSSEVKVLHESVDTLSGQNALLQRQLEDIDYLNLFDINDRQDVILPQDRKKVLKRLRRLRHENPLAKQSVKLILRFTLGKGVELIVGPDPEKEPPTPAELPVDGPKTNGLFPGSKPNPNTTAPLLATRNRPQIGEAIEADVSNLITDELKTQLNDFWMDDENQLSLTSRAALQEFVDHNATDGEKMLLLATGATAPYVKVSDIPIEEIDLIIYDPNNRKRPVWYRRRFANITYDGKAEQFTTKPPQTKYYLDWRIDQEDLDGTASEPGLDKLLSIPKSKRADDTERIMHTYINPLWGKSGKRGISDLYSSREWFRVYKEFMEDRAAINAAATAVAYKRKIKGGPTDVARITGTLGGTPVGFDSPNQATVLNTTRRPAGAGIYDSNTSADLEWMKTDTGAQNAKDDGRSIITAAGAGMGIFQQYLGDGGDANLATAQAMELPMVKMFEDWQQWLDDIIRDLCYFVIKTATDEENAKKQIIRIATSFPPIVSRDVVKYMTAWSQLVQNIASGNKEIRKQAIKGALTVMDTPNIDSIMQDVEMEEAQLEAERQARQQAMNDAMMNPSPFGNGNGNGGKARDGNSNSLPPDLKTVAKGNPPPERLGSKSS